MRASEAQELAEVSDVSIVWANSASFITYHTIQPMPIGANKVVHRVSLRVVLLGPLLQKDMALWSVVVAFLHVQVAAALGALQHDVQHIVQQR